MASVKQTISEVDVVRLRDAVGEWPAGTRGTVVSEHGKDKLIEISDLQGVTLDLITVAEPRLELIAKHGR